MTFDDNVDNAALQGAPLNESDHCGDPPLLLAAGNGETVCAAGHYLNLGLALMYDQYNVQLTFPYLN